MNISERIDFITKNHIHVCRSSTLKSHFRDLTTLRRWPYFFVLFSTGNELLHCIENERVHVPLGHFLFVGPDRYHSFIDGQDGDFWVLYFDYGFYARTPNDAYFIQNNPLFFDLDKIYISKPAIDISEYVALQMEFLEKLITKIQTPLVIDIIHNAVQAILLRSTFLSQGLQNPEVQYNNIEDRKIANQFRELLHIHYQQEKKLDYYANALKTTPRRLNQAITNIYGRSAKQLVTEKIFEESKSLLAHSFLTIKEISYSMGFTEENNFSAFFTKHSGYSPKKYKNLQLNISAV
ncbi:helix-turn-helix domain-containing protein [Pedobacter mucosus]|uniref:helix-turn-helix domain-containing protein n=1 Tax=Pedobacter mucosus TaxID=2895286 RepID=UPI001EE4E644|nr:helix-turn-helix domain-containing protein [Pedobacter mucosus]UKT62966.1 AraC family transcriptional regulator [Pedobacter mucosus]